MRKNDPLRYQQKFTNPDELTCLLDQNAFCPNYVNDAQDAALQIESLDFE